MSCFKLPKDVCSKLTSAMIEFWWSSGNNKKKISWVSWKKLCTEKELGGLGFKDLEKFNQSLLAKQAWRIWSAPDSLLSRILNHRYCQSSDFLNCGEGSRPSYAWRSILHGRDLLKDGLLHKIGDGRNTKVWLDNWLLDSCPRPPRYRQGAVVDLTLTVHDLVDVRTRRWNVDLVRELIKEEDVAMVLNTKLALDRTDAIVWGLSKNGCYDSKSGYKFIETLITIRSDAQPSVPPIEKLLWTRLWKAKTSPKLRHFLWRVMSGALAVKAQLRTRGIPVDITCPVCNQGSETICHLLFHCPLAKEVWELSRFPVPAAGWSPNSIFLNIHHLLVCSQKQNIGAAVRLSFPWLLWQIWKARNKLCFEQASPVAVEVVTKAKEEAVLWLNSNGCLPGSPHVASTAPSSVAVWSKPPPSVLKCNIGSSWSASSLMSGASFIVRNSAGNSLYHSRRSFSGVTSSTQAALQALLWAISTIVELRLKSIHFEFSHPEAASALNNPLQIPVHYHLCHEVVNMLYTMVHGSLGLVPDSCNVAASAIAVSVTRDQRHQSYLAAGEPRWLSPVLANEALIN